MTGQPTGISSRPPQRAGARPLALLLVLGLGGCATAPPEPPSADPLSRWIAEQAVTAPAAATPAERSAEIAPEPDASAPAQLEPPATGGDARTSAMVSSAMNFLGVRYRRGGNSAEQGFDCSGFTRHVFGSSLGLELPRRSQDQARAPGLSRIDRAELQPGDLVFFNTLRAAYSHVGIYIGDGRFIHAPRSGSAVRVENMRLAYWTKRYNGARRAAQAEAVNEAMNESTMGRALPAY